MEDAHVTKESAPSDLDLIAAIASKDVQALEAVYDRYGSFAFNLAKRILEDGALAEDVVQEVFFNLWRQAGSFDRRRGSVKNWLLSSTHHKAIDVLRMRQGKVKRDVPLTEAEYRLMTPDPWDAVVNHLDRSMLREIMAQLPDEQRKTLEMAYFQGMSHSEVSEATGTPLGTVKGRLRLALEKMKAGLEARGVWTAV